MSGIGDRFHQETKYTPEKIGGKSLDWDRKPDPFKNYENPLAVIQLPEPNPRDTDDLWTLLQRRRSRRAYAEERPLTKGVLSTLLWSTQGVTAGHGNILFRTSPSAGALYPIETYLFLRAVEGLETGIYHFRPNHFDLEFLRKGDLSQELTAAALGQNMILHAPLTFLWTALVERSKWKYEQRAYRYIYLDAGHIAENLYLAGEALGMGVCTIGAFFDDRVNDLLGLDGEKEFILYMATVGYRRGG
jgi:SagB-type dehydrogenase family enzyme